MPGTGQLVEPRRVTLALRGYVDLPPHAAGGFDHGDVHIASRRVFVAHTANGTVDVIDGEQLAYERSVGGCPEASGVLCAQGGGELVFAAARGGGKVLVVDPASCAVLREIPVGPKPNGLAWDPRRQHLLVADVEEPTARLVDPSTGDLLARIDLPGRPRWCAYDAARDRFLVNVRDPACMVTLAAASVAETGRIPLSAAGPHGLELDAASGCTCSYLRARGRRSSRRRLIPADNDGYMPGQRLYWDVASADGRDGTGTKGNTA